MAHGLYSTGAAAALCGVSRSTFKRWFSRAMPAPRRTPGGDIRISREELAAFAKEFGIALPEDVRAVSALVAVADHALENGLVSALRRVSVSNTVTVAREETTFGFELARLQPGLVIISPAAAPGHTAARARRIRELSEPRCVRIGLAASADDSLALPGGPDLALGEDTRRAALDEFVQRLCRPADGDRAAS